MNPAAAQDILRRTVLAGLPVLLVGAPGVGKTAIVQALANELDYRLVVSHPVTADPTDFCGHPWMIDGHASFLPIGDLARLAELDGQRGIWLIDDLGQALTPAAPGREDDLRLTASIAREGVRENLLVRPAAAGRYELLVGDRRLRCAIAAGRAEVPAIVRALDDRQARVFTLGENLRRDRLHFLDEADAVAGLVEEDWTYQEIAAHVRQPLSWAARRHRLMNLTPAWRQLAENSRGFVANWSAADFEEIAILEPDSQTDLLTRSRHRLERCATVRELAQLIRSLTPAITSFPWSP
jgi:hypothetical protein